MSHLAPDAGSRFGWEGMKDVPPFVDHDPTSKGFERRRDDPNVLARMEHLKANAGIKGLEVCEPHELERIVKIFLRDGFCAVKDVIDEERLPKIQAACTALIAERVAETPDGVTRGVHPETKKEFVIRQPGRYSFGSHGNLHRREWCMLADLPRLHPILEAIFQSKDYMCWGAGGDFCLPGTIEYQHLHRDCGEGMFHDPSGRVRLWDLPPPLVTCNFPMVDFNALNGPIRQIPGTQNTYDQPPSLEDEPEWMKLSAVAPLNAGGVIIRDLRAWHGGTPNLSEEVRAIPNVEFLAPWFWSQGMMTKTMPHERWLELSEQGKHACRFIKCDPGEVPPQLRLAKQGKL